MNDPYKVLGVSPSASDDEIKQAYRDLAKKYHPDNYAGSPIADLAGEKMSEINAAYDEVQAQRRNGGTNARQNSMNYGQATGWSGGQFDDIRRLISIGRMFEAEELLNGVPTVSRDAEWHFLKGNVLYSRGFLEDSLTYFQSAVQLDPQNMEYRNTLDTILRRRQNGFGSAQADATYTSCSPCNFCSALVCADCTCSACRCCCGG